MAKLLTLLIAWGFFSPFSFSQVRYFLADNNAPDGFVFTPSTAIESFIVPLQDVEEIKRARLISRMREKGVLGDFSDLVYGAMFLEVERGSDGINADLINGTTWNWHVNKLEVFYSLGPPPAGFSTTEVEAFANSGTFESISPGNPDVRLLTIWGTYKGELPLQSAPMDASGFRTTWFGTFYDRYYPWVYQPGNGWMYIRGFDPESIWIYSHARSEWLWTRESLSSTSSTVQFWHSNSNAWGPFGL